VLSTVDRKTFQKLAKERLGDAKALLGRKRWSGAYYLCGYAVECALKACLLRHLGESGAIFSDERRYLKDLADCWTHDLSKLVRLAGLEAKLGAARGANPKLAKFWGVTSGWSETSRYEEKTEAEARALYEAVCNNPDGVFRWMKSHW
jgi:HEPN domain-containing protein